MTRSRRTRNNAGRRNTAIMAGGGLLLLGALLYWGGTAQPGAAFWPGVAVAGGLVLGVGWLIWWLLLSSLPAGERVAANPAPALRQAAAYLVAAGGVVFLIGALWDAAWRQMAGAADSGGFGWQPNLLIYGSVGLIAATALGAALVAARGLGSLRARWRSDAPLGLLGLLSLFALLVMAAGLLWPGVDATGVPAQDTSHVLLGVGMAAVMLGAAAVQTSLLPQPAGWTIHRLGGGELNTVILLAVAAAILLLAGAGAWGHSPDNALRPAWYYPAVILGVTLFIGQVGLHVLQRPGAAILIFAAALFLRAITNFLFQQFYGMTEAGATAEFLALIPAAAMDVVYVYRTDEAGAMSTSWLAIGVGSAAMLAGGLWLLPRLVAYPPVDGATLPGLLIAGAGVGVFGGWCGARLGRAVSGVRRVPLPAAMQARVAVIGAGAYIILLVAAFFLMQSASLPQ